MRYADENGLNLQKCGVLWIATLTLLARNDDAFCHFVITVRFVILSVATQRVARRKPQQINPKD